VVADTFGSNFGTALAAYTGGSLATLENIDCVGGGFFFIDGHPAPTPTQIAFTGNAGETYYFQAGGSFGDTGNLVFNLRGAPLPPCSPNANLGFEASLQDTNVIPCWTVVDQAGSSGSWCNQRDTTAPQGSCSGLFNAVLSPPAGLQAAMTNSLGFEPGSHVLYRCGELESEEISFELYLNNQGFEFSSPLSLDYRRFPNQQFRADLVTAAGIAADPFTIRPADILVNIYQTEEGDEPVSFEYTTIVANASGRIGQNVCLRFAEVDNFWQFNVGVDDVHFDTAKDPAGDSDGDTIPNSADPNYDNDGCTDAQELGPNPGLGGMRDPHNFWDFFDTPPRDRQVTVGDIGRVVAHFGDFGDPNMDLESEPPSDGYHPAFDRTPLGPGIWNAGAPDGSVTIQDLGLVVAQFGHSCSGG